MTPREWKETPWPSSPAERWVEWVAFGAAAVGFWIVLLVGVTS